MNFHCCLEQNGIQWFTGTTFGWFLKLIVINTIKYIAYLCFNGILLFLNISLIKIEKRFHYPYNKLIVLIEGKAPIQHFFFKASDSI